MQKKKRKPSISSLADLRFNIVDVWDGLKAGEITPTEANVYAKLGMVIVKTIDTESETNRLAGVVKEIDFLPQKQISNGVQP